MAIKNSEHMGNAGSSDLSAGLNAAEINADLFRSAGAGNASSSGAMPPSMFGHRPSGEQEQGEEKQTGEGQGASANMGVGNNSFLQQGVSPLLPGQGQTYMARNIPQGGHGVFGSGECAALTQELSGAPLTKYWAQGADVRGNTSIPKGTVIATFDENGVYANRDHGNHTAIYLGQDEKGILVYDQWQGHPPGVRHINFQGKGNGNVSASNNADAYSVVATQSRNGELVQQRPDVYTPQVAADITRQRAASQTAGIGGLHRGIVHQPSQVSQLWERAKSFASNIFNPYSRGGGQQQVEGTASSGSSVDARLTEFVKGYEGFTARAQWDYGQYSVGYGTKAKSPDEVLTKPQAEARLQQELVAHKTRVMDAAGKRGLQLSDNQLIALTSFDYNTGKGAHLISTSGSMQEIKGRMLQYTKADGEELRGLVTRRGAEAQLLGSDRQLALAGRIQDTVSQGRYANQRTQMASADVAGTNYGNSHDARPTQQQHAPTQSQQYARGA